jgi:hypothetical protein
MNVAFEGRSGDGPPFLSLWHLIRDEQIDYRSDQHATSVLVVVQSWFEKLKRPVLDDTLMKSGAWEFLIRS